METINFADLKKRLKTQIDYAYLLSGRDLFLLDYSVKLITEACNVTMPELNYIKFTEDETNADDVIKALETMPMMCDRKVVYVNVSTKADSLKNEKKIVEYLENPSSTSVLNVSTKADSLKNEKKIVEYLENPSSTSVLIISAGENKIIPNAKNVVLIDCNKLSEDFILSYMNIEFKKNSKTISKQCAKKLNEFCMSDMMQITTEISKLSSFAGNREEILESDLEKVVNKNVEYQIFELSEALAKKDASKAFMILNKFKEKKNSSQMLFPLIYSHFRRLFFTAISGLDRKALANELGVKEYAVSKYAEQTRNFKKVNLKEIVDLCAEAEFAIKNGTMDKDNALELIILKILNI